jgi:sugar-specific transcriptional regulator TrmB
MKVCELSLKRVFKTLESLGLSQAEARIYVFLEKNGSHKDIDIAHALNLHWKEFVSNLKKLQDKKIVKASAKQTIELSAVPFEKAIDLLIQLKKEQAQSLQERKRELLSSWQNVTKKESENNSCTGVC